MAKNKIEWIDKPGGSHNPQTRIERVGGSLPHEWQWPAQKVIDAINNRSHTFYVQVGTEYSDVEVDYRNNVPYLRTESDGTPIDNLLSLGNISTR